jgi:creatinine amidohydrolase/Fe(II)-dependent formamide hydrolase-like protein
LARKSATTGEARPVTLIFLECNMSIYMTPGEAKRALHAGNLEAEVAAAAARATLHRAEAKDAFEAGKADALERLPNRNLHPFNSPTWASYNRGYNMNYRSQ